MSTSFLSFLFSFLFFKKEKSASFRSGLKYIIECILRQVVFYYFPKYYENSAVYKKIAEVKNEEVAIIEGKVININKKITENLWKHTAVCKTEQI